jgi:hypothetical protein
VRPWATGRRSRSESTDPESEPDRDSDIILLFGIIAYYRDHLNYSAGPGFRALRYRKYYAGAASHGCRGAVTFIWTGIRFADTL